ncbi:MAG: diaminopimelate epimerase [Myxococcales bacterium]|nr:diaminopimelate epimerase [Myxococcales bacterium]
MSDRAIPITKMSGSGNDFILVDNRQRWLDPDRAAPWVRAVCRRALSVGADGVILLEADPRGEADFAWRFFNSDGSEAEMCGNGGRCAARFAHDAGLAGETLTFRTKVGLIRGWVLGGREVRVGLTPPRDYRSAVEIETAGGRVRLAAIDTGVPHAVWRVADLAAVPVVGWGRPARHHPAFAPRGTNVDFVQILGEQDVAIRTYERGVEDETLACGTGCAAAAVTLGLAGEVKPPVRLLTRGGETLIVDFRQVEGRIADLTLQGPVRYVFRGELHSEALL